MNSSRLLLQLAIAGCAAAFSCQPLPGAAQGFDAASGRAIAPVRQNQVDTIIEPGDKDRKNYAASHKDRHANCDRSGPERGDEVGCGKKVKDDKEKDKDK